MWSCNNSLREYIILFYEWGSRQWIKGLNSGVTQLESGISGPQPRAPSALGVNHPSADKPTGMDQLGDELTSGFYCLTDAVRKKQQLRVQSNGLYHHSDLHEATSGQDNSAAGVVYWWIKVLALERGPDANEALQLRNKALNLSETPYPHL